MKWACLLLFSVLEFGNPPRVWLRCCLSSSSFYSVATEHEERRRNPTPNSPSFCPIIHASLFRRRVFLFEVKMRREFVHTCFPLFSPPKKEEKNRTERILLGGRREEDGITAPPPISPTYCCSSSSHFSNFRRGGRKRKAKRGKRKGGICMGKRGGK